MLWRACRPPQRLSARCSPFPLRSDSRRSFTTTLRNHQDPKTTHDGQVAGASVAPNADLTFSRHFRATELFSLQPSEVPTDEVTVTGLVRSIRKQKHACFAHISDGSTLEPVQAVLAPEKAALLHNGAYVELWGKWQPSPAKGQSFELQTSDVKVHGECDPEVYPIQKKSLPNEYLRNYLHLRFRTPFNSLLMRVRSQLLKGLSNFFSGSEKFKFAFQVHPPLITSSDCEGAGEVFTITPSKVAKENLLREQIIGDRGQDAEEYYFRTSKYLTVSTQLHLEAFSAELGHVWAMSPTFRAEPSDTPRHISEFYMFEAELRDVEELEDMMTVIEGGIKSLIETLRDSDAGKDLTKYYATQQNTNDMTKVGLDGRWMRLLEEQWKRMSYTSAMEILHRAYATNRSLFHFEPQWSSGLNLEHERWIVEHIGGGQPVFITDYPKIIKPFYMLPSPRQSEEAEGPTVACFDLLFPDGCAEVVGGSLREHRLEKLIENMRERGMLEPKFETPARDHKLGNGLDGAVPPGLDYPHLHPGEELGSLKWYADLRRFGSSPHGGFGMGFDRLVMYLTGVENIRDVVPFPRTWGRAEC